MNVRTLLPALPLVLLVSAVACGPAPEGLDEPADTAGEATPADPEDPEGEPPVSFTADVLPVFQNNCVQCHSGSPGDGSFDLTPERAAASLFERTPGVACFEDGVLVERDYIVPGAPEESLLWIKVSDTDFSLECGREMPPTGNGPLLHFAPDAAETLRLWIASGAPVGDAG